ncbi:MAG: DUF480 domain-containing protein [Planctomycetes bacterium]|nr:DUF480 domain-containing protein [Planctomycetota bacterium]NBY00950.1 DUF480 domain-containing protein [Planctomycetota bacterium]
MQLAWLQLPSLEYTFKSIEKPFNKGIVVENQENSMEKESVTEQIWPALDILERRILGVLIEKAKTTPEAYPLSLNALVNAANQKSNRDPVMNLQDYQVETGIRNCIAKGLISMVRGGRVERWQHELYTKWNLSKRDMSVLGELLLRGPQTEGLLRTRAGRMETFDSLEDLREALDSLAARKLILWVDPKGVRGARVTHGFHSPDEIARIRSTAISVADDDLPASRRNNDAVELRDLVSSLQEEVKTLREELRALKAQLGV